MTKVAELERQVQSYKANVDQVEKLRNDFSTLQDCGLLRCDETGNYHAVESWEEHQ